MERKGFWHRFIYGKHSVWLWFILLIICGVLLYQINRLCSKYFGFDIIFFAWIGALLVALCIFAAKRATKEALKLTFAYLSIVPLCLIVGEIYGLYMNYTKDKKLNNTECNKPGSHTYTENYFRPDSIVGYKGTPNIIANSKRMYPKNNEVIYDVTYHIGENGWRLTPSSNEESKTCAIFFGDSFTIGEGVEDNETLPFYFGKNTNFTIYNFGFHGYGPHQALALLQSGEVKKIVKDCENFIGFYESLPTHIERANGFSPWENDMAPRFRLDNGKVTQITKQHTKSKLQIRFESIVNKSQLAKMLKSQYFKPQYQFGDESNQLFFAIIQEIQKELKEQFGAPLYFILWDSNNLSDTIEKNQAEAITNWLQTSNIQYMLLSNIIDDYTTHREKYALHTCDTHPNALANEKIAAFLSQKIKEDGLQSFDSLLVNKNTKKDTSHRKDRNAESKDSAQNPKKEQK